jgi:ribosome-binding factor A
MAKEFSRTQRVADVIQKEVAQIIQRDVKDPRLGMVTILDVTVSKDLFFADIYVSFLDLDGKDLAPKFAVLKKTESFIRSSLSKKIKLRVIPEIRFHLDESSKRSNYISDLIDKAIARDNENGGND